MKKTTLRIIAFILILFILLPAFGETRNTRNFQPQSLFEILYLFDTALNMQVSYYQTQINENNIKLTRIAKDTYRVEGRATLNFTEKDKVLMPTQRNFRELMPTLFQLIERNRNQLQYEFTSGGFSVTTNVENCHLRYQIRQNAEENVLELDNTSNYFSCSDFPTDERWTEMYQALPLPF
jgi:hypothetical protein